MAKEKQLDGLKFSTWLLLASALALFIFSSVMWRKFVVFSDNRVFWGSIENALSTNGVTVFVNESADFTINTVQIRQDLMGELSVEATSEFKDDAIDTIIRTVSTKDKDYLYYQKNQNQDNPALQKLEGTWVDIGVADQTESKTLADNLTNGTVIFTANLTPSDRKEFMNQLREEKVYTIMNLVRTEDVDGNESRVYSVKINAGGYNRALKKLLEYIGLSEASSQVDTGIPGDQEITVQIQTLTTQKRIVATGFPDITSKGARTYSGWGDKYSFELPTDFISSEELQKRLDETYTPSN